LEELDHALGRYRREYKPEGDENELSEFDE